MSREKHALHILERHSAIKSSTGTGYNADGPWKWCQGERPAPRSHTHSVTRLDEMPRGKSTERTQVSSCRGPGFRYPRQRKSSRTSEFGCTDNHLTVCPLTCLKWWLVSCLQTTLLWAVACSSGGEGAPYVRECAGPVVTPPAQEAHLTPGQRDQWLHVGPDSYPRRPWPRSRSQRWGGGLLLQTPPLEAPLCVPCRSASWGWGGVRSLVHEDPYTFWFLPSHRRSWQTALQTDGHERWPPQALLQMSFPLSGTDCVPGTRGTAVW